MTNVTDIAPERERRIKEVAKTGGGGDNGGMWEQSVENRLGQLHEDIRDTRNFLLLAYGAGFVILAGLMAKGFGWL
jgi:hypothetical protein